MKIDSHPFTGEPVLRAGWFARLLGKKFYTRQELMEIAFSHRAPGQGYLFGEAPPDTWYNHGIWAINREAKRRRSINPKRMPSVLTGSAPELLGVKAVVFDVFGTLVRIGEKRRPYLRVHQLLKAQGRQPQPDDSIRTMSTNVGLAGVPDLFGVEIDASLVAPLELELYAELPTIRCYDETLTTLEALRKRGYKLGLCSNLAAPYAVPVKLLLPPLDAYAWSFEVGATKPDPKMYEHICNALGCRPDQVLMVGDTLEADYTGPQRFGMHVCHLSRDGSSDVERAIRRLDQILPMLGAQ